MACNGFGMNFMDNMVINALMRVVVQSNENCLYCIALDTIKALG